MDQFNLFRSVAHVWIEPNVVQIPAAAYADNLSIDSAISAGHGVYHRAERQPSGEERRADQSKHETTLALCDNPASNVTYAWSRLTVAESQLHKDESST